MLLSPSRHTFFIGRPLEAIPNDLPDHPQSIGLLRRWQLCQALTTHLWKRWSNDYIAQLNKFTKWKVASPNVKVGDIVCLKQEPTTSSKWPLARIIEVHPGPDGKVRVATVRTEKGIYKRSIWEIVPLLHQDDHEQIRKHDALAGGML